MKKPIDIIIDISIFYKYYMINSHTDDQEGTPSKLSALEVDTTQRTVHKL